MPVTISDEVLAAAQISEPELKREIALTLFRKGRLTLAQASRLAELPQPEFETLLAERQIPADYAVSDFGQDFWAFLRDDRRTWPVISALFIAAYFLIYTRGALHSYFSDDDLANLYRAWIPSLGALVKANVLFFLNSSFYRPLASVWYRLVFYFFGFNPVPFHATNLVFLGTNIWLTYCVARRLTNSREIGAVTALLVAYHPSFGPLYFDTGFIFDVLCYLFYFAAFLFYLRIRQQDRRLNVQELAVLAGLFICALNCKEMAATLPAAVMLYEAIYRRTRPDVRTFLVLGGLAIVFAAGRFLMPSGESLAAMGAYRPMFSWKQFMLTSDNFFGDLFLKHRPFRTSTVLAIWAGMVCAARLARSRTLAFAWLFLMLSAIPIAFILPRGGAQYYVCLFGWALFAATVFVKSAEYLLDHLPGALRPDLGPARGAALLLAAALLLYPVYGETGWSNVPSVSIEGEHLRSIEGQLHTLRPSLRPGSKIIFMDDPMDDSYRMMFLVQESYRDPSLTVDRVPSMQAPPDAEKMASYDYLFDYRLGSLYTSLQSRPGGDEPAIELEWGWPALFHTDFAQVTPENPARPGEELIARVTGLGETTPPTPPGQPFPKDALRRVVAEVSLEIGGKPAQVELKVGWPEKTNTYRLDFRVPYDIGRGETSAQITSARIAGPPVRLLLE